MSELILEQTLPKSWIKTNLENVVEILDGKRIPINSRERQNRKGNIPYYGATGQVGLIDDYLFDEELVLLGEDGAPFFEPFKNKAYLIEGKSWINNHAHVLRGISELLINKFLCYYLNQIDYHNYVNGTTRLKLNQASMKIIPIILPPLNEQKRIVEKVEELFSLIENNKKTLEAIRKNLKLYQNSFLINAFSGKLTENWRKNNSNVQSSFDLIQEIQKNRMEQFNLESNNKIKNKLKKNLKISILSKNSEINSWLNVKLENLVYIAGRIGWRGLKSDEYTKEGPLFLSVYNLNDGHMVDFSKVHHISKERYDESPEIQIKNNDILLVKDGAGIGKISIVKNLIQKTTVNSSLLVIHGNEAFVPEFLFYFLYGPELQNIAKKRITGSTTPHLFQRDIKKFQLFLPPLKEQNEIVKIIENGISQIRKIDSILSSEIYNTQVLKITILKQVFEGKLIPQDPNDEPAEILLQKIKQEKQLIQKQKASRRSKNVK